ncbi:MAG: hypothetical protein QNJ34_05610 [Xenococcaceae cyanobacterium MO_188.B29]|nr:hypothetical protein [Xenococcaceae cyanobacterium MO_188.B29]
MTFKWVVGAIVARVAFVSIWKYTQWARVVRTEEQNCLENTINRVGSQN